MLIEYDKKTDYDFDGIEFCMKALSKDKNEKRQHVLCFACLDGNEIAATDGKRLHIYQLSKEIEEGFYKPFKTTGKISLCKVDGFDYPKYHDIIPKSEPDKQHTLKSEDNFNEILHAVYALFSVDDTMNYLFLKDIAGEMYDVSYYGDQKMTVFKSNTRTAIIMQIKITNP